MIFTLDTRPSESAFVEQVWQARSLSAGSFISTAASHWEMVVTRTEGRSATLTVRGPATKATPLDVAADGEWLGIRFRPGAVMPHLPAGGLVDGAVTLPDAGSHGFWLHSMVLPFPDFEHADTFVERLVRRDLLQHDPMVNAAMRGDLTDLSLRTVQRRFLHATGLTPRMIRQIERARQAMTLLHQGVSILDTVHEAGYYDQPHLTRSLKRFLGQTPAQIAGIGQNG